MNSPVMPDDLVSNSPAEQTRGIGDNNPPAFDQSALDEAVKSFDDFMSASKVWLDLPKIETDDHASKATDMITGLRKLFKEIDDTRKAQKKPHDDAGKKVQAAFTPYLEKVKAAGDKLKPKLAEFLDAKEKRLEEERRKAEAVAQEEARLAAAALAKAEAENDISAQVDAEQAIKASEKAVKKAGKPVRASTGSATGAGRTISLRKVKTVEVTNIRMLFMHYQNHPDVHDLLRRLATEDVRSSEVDSSKIPGIAVTEKAAAA